MSWYLGLFYDLLLPAAVNGKGSAHLKRCFQSHCPSGPLGRLKLDGAMLGMTWHHKTLCTSEHDNRVNGPVLTGAIKLTGQWLRCRSSPVSTCLCSLGKRCHQATKVKAPVDFLLATKIKQVSWGRRVKTTQQDFSQSSKQKLALVNSVKMIH